MTGAQRCTSEQRPRSNALDGDTECRIAPDRQAGHDVACQAAVIDLVNRRSAEPLVIAAAQALASGRRGEAERLLRRLRAVHRLPLTLGTHMEVTA